jgi:outer membrane protein assembly factor BamB
MTRRHLRDTFLTLLFFSAAGMPLFGQTDVLRYVTGGLSPGPPASVDDELYVVSEDRYLYAFDYEGLRLWRADLRRRPIGPAVLGPDGTIYVARDNRGISAYNRRGDRLWDVEIPDITFPPTVSPRGLLVVSRNDGWISVLSPSGRLLNSFRGPGTLGAEPLLSTNGYLVLLGARGVLTVVDGAGNRLWGTSFSRVPSAVAVVEEGGLALGFDDGRLLFLDADGQVSGEWRAPAGIRDLRIGGTTVAVTLTNGVLWVLDRDNGRVWEAGPPGAFLSGVVIGERRIAAVSRGGRLFFYSPLGYLLREYQLPEKPGLGDPTILVGGGVAAVGSNWVVYLFPTDEAGCAAPWGCFRGGPGLPGRSNDPGSRDLVLPSAVGGSLERIYFERLLSSDDPEERRTGLDAVASRLEEGRLGSIRVYIVPLLRSLALEARGPGRSAGERRRAIGILAQIGTYEATGALSDLVAGVEVDLLESLAEALGGLGSDPTGRAARSLHRILQREPSPRVATAVVEAAYRLVAYAGRIYSPAIEEIVSEISQGSYPLSLKRRAYRIGSLESHHP